MAKEPSRRFASCTEFAAQLAWQLALVTPTPRRFQRFHPPNTRNPRTSSPRPALTRAAPVVRAASRKRQAVLACIVLLIVGVVFEGVRLTSIQHPGDTTVTANLRHRPLPSPNTGPFWVLTRSLSGWWPAWTASPAEAHVIPTSELWEVRSVCRPAGCVATASRLDGDTMQVPTMVLDEVGGSWVAVSVGSSTCGNVEGEVWEVFTLQPLPDGTLTGGDRNHEQGLCQQTQRPHSPTGDVDVNTLPDPAALPARVESPAAALHGRYHQTSTQPNGFTDQRDYVAHTDCLRNGDRCVSVFHTAPTTVLLLLYAAGNWTYEREFDARVERRHRTCANRGAVRVAPTAPGRSRCSRRSRS